MGAQHKPAGRGKADAPDTNVFGSAMAKRPALICLVLGLAILAVYWRAGGNGYVDYDDGDYVTGNTHVQAGLTWSTIVWAFKTGFASNWHPLTWLSHALDCQIFGFHAGPQHLVSVAFHLLNSVLLFLVFRRMTRATWRSALIAAFFAFHPLHVESVAWISERKDVLSAFFFILTLGAYAIYAERSRLAPGYCRGDGGGDKVKDKGRDKVGGGVAGRFGGAWTWYLLSLLCFTLGLMSKPMLVTLPCVLLLVDYWPLQRFQLTGGDAGEEGARARSKEQGARKMAGIPAGKSTNPPPTPETKCGGQSAEDKVAHHSITPSSSIFFLLLEKLPFFALAAASSVVTFFVQQAGGAVSTALDPGARIGNAVISYIRYLAKTLWPVDLSVLYPHPGHWPIWQVAAAAVVLALIFATVIFLGRNRPWLAMGWFWFFGMLVPTIGLVQVGIQSMADRYMYLPVIGLFIILFWGLPEILPAEIGRSKAPAVACIVALLACAGLTMRQIGYWHDTETLFTRAVKVTDKNYLAYNNLGYYFSHHDRVNEAMENYQRSLEINPNYEEALNNMGFALAGQKRHAEAIPYYERALRIKPDHPEVLNNLGNALSELGGIDQAIEYYHKALDKKPDHADAHNNLGVALAMKGKLDEALPHFHQAIEAKPTDASAHSNLGNALAVQRRLDEAVKEYEIALRLKPNESQTHNNIGNALTGLNRLDEAVGHYQEALRLNPQNPEAHANLATALAAQGKLPEAIEHFQTALRFTPNSPDLHFRLAETFRLQGRRDTAVAHLTEALRLRPNFPEAKRQLEALNGK